MAVKIRLKRAGTKKKPFYRIIAVDERTKRDGMDIEQLGRYQPIVEKDQFIIDETKTINWLKKGAVPTNTMLTLLKKHGTWKKFKEN